MNVLRASLIAAALMVMMTGGMACVRPDGETDASSGDGAAAEEYVPKEGQDGKDVVWIPTSQQVADRMLDLARLTPHDRLVDLGSGDGITVITAARRGATARGIEYNPDLVALARRNAQARGVSDRATFEQADIFASDFSEATVVTLFLLPSLNLQLRPTLLDMAPGTRIVSNTFDMDDWLPDETTEVTSGCTTYCEALLWIVPARIAGTWTLDGKVLQLAQDFQTIEGSLRDGAATLPLAGRLEGAKISFSTGNERYVGEVSGNTMRGTIDGSRPWQASRVE